MKKTLIALAAVAVSSAAFAQSTVTLYGKVNASLYKKQGVTATMNDAADGSGSRWGLRGTEDLGGGMKANYMLENGFLTDTGSLDNTANQLFQRASWMGLSGGFGEVRFGRQYTLGFDASIATMPSTTFSAQRTVDLNFNGIGSRNSDMIKYISPSFGGLTVKASTQLKGDNAKAVTELAVAYAAGPLTANLNTAKAKTVAGTTYSMNATYNLGVASVTGGYTDLAGTNTGKGFQFGVSAPMGDLTPYAAVARNSDTKATSVELGAYYALSKRTKAYGLINTRTTSADTANRYTVGLDHSF